MGKKYPNSHPRPGLEHSLSKLRVREAAKCLSVSLCTVLQHRGCSHCALPVTLWSGTSGQSCSLGILQTRTEVWFKSQQRMQQPRCSQGGTNTSLILLQGERSWTQGSQGTQRAAQLLPISSSCPYRHWEPEMTQLQAARGKGQPAEQHLLLLSSLFLLNRTPQVTGEGMLYTRKPLCTELWRRPK